MNYTIRACNDFSDYEKCMEMQRNIWSSHDIEITPPRVYIISNNAGGFLLGAFNDQQQLIGFLHTFPGFDKDGRPFYYSHMLAIIPELQNSGIGRELKLKQREYALNNKIDKIIWTFDPLRARNAHFNINKLGCIVPTYKINFYGSASFSIFDANIESDRVMTEWWVKSPRVIDVINNKQPSIDANAPFIEIPNDFTEIRERSLAEAQQWRLNVRKQFQDLLAQGWIVTNFSRGHKEQFARYYFSRQQE